MKKVICINGAPGSGKDTIGKILKTNNPRSGILKISDPLSNVAKNLLGASDKEFQILRERDKEKPLSEFGVEISLRQLLINISEELVKPSLGEDWLPKQVVYKMRSLSSLYDMFIITDSGFQNEFDKIKSMLDDNVKLILINIRREGHTFANDSREDVSDDGNEIVIHNNGTIEELESLLQLEIFNV